MKIDYNNIDILQPLVQDYLAGKPGLEGLFNYTPDIASIGKAISDKGTGYNNRGILTAAVQKQYAGIKPIEQVNVHIQKLSQPNTFTITTAHQPNLFGGPLYFVTKILSAVKTALLLSEAYPDYTFVPVYWMGSEDHDAEELNHINLFNNRIQWEAPFGGPFGRLPTDSLAGVLEQIAPLLENTAYKDACMSLLQVCYLKEPTIGAATRVLVHTLFGKYGVVVVDGDDADLKQLFKPVIIGELTHPQSKTLADKNSALLEQQGYTPQAFARPINLFYLEAHGRHRIELEDGIYKIHQTEIRFTPSEILDIASAHPEQFSPNVILRGLYQETVLPNLIFIGGGAEVSYWMQLKALFDHYRVNMPMLLQRDLALLVDISFPQKWAASGFDMTDLFKDENTLIKNYLERQSDMQFTDFSAELLQTADIFAALKHKLEQVDKTLINAADAELSKAQQMIENLSNKGVKALKRKHDNAVQMIKDKKQKYMPGGVLQERHYNFLQWYSKTGPAMFDTMLNDFNPFDRALTVLEL